MPNYKFVFNKPMSMFLPVKLSTLGVLYGVGALDDDLNVDLSPTYVHLAFI